MKGKYVPKYLAEEDKNKKSVNPVVYILCIALVLCAALLVCRIWLPGTESPEEVGGTEPTETHQNQPTQPTEEKTAPDGYHSVNTAYCTLLISSDYADDFRHVEISQDGVTAEVFYMLLENGERELFRINFGDAGTSEKIGSLQTENGEISVSIGVCTYQEEDFASAEQYQKYHTLMDQLDTVISSVRSDSRFVAAGDRGENTEPPQKMGLTYWDLDLPESMECEEHTSDDVYQADFYGIIGGERILLYSLYLGDVNPESVMGMFEADGEEKALSAVTYDLEMQIPEPDAETRAEFYKFMRTINDVLQVIMSSENFSENTAE